VDHTPGQPAAIDAGHACNALHGLEAALREVAPANARSVGTDEFLLKHEFLAIMLGTTRRG
jgi:hypothetical protein